MDTHEAIQAGNGALALVSFDRESSCNGKNWFSHYRRMKPGGRGLALFSFCI